MSQHPAGWPLSLVVAVALAGCGAEESTAPFVMPSGPIHQETIHAPLRLTSIETGELDVLGRPVRIACATCHSQKDTATMPTTPNDLVSVHKGLSFDHGDLSCASCHVVAPNAAPKLRLADGREIPTQEALSLCGQCHGPQIRDYRHGAHGGMSGHWDLTRGPRTRNHCVDCHDPHVPRIPAALPAPRAKDHKLGNGSNH